MSILSWAVTGRSRRSRDDGRLMSARNLKRSSSLSRSASYMGPAPVSLGQGARGSPGLMQPAGSGGVPGPGVGHLLKEVCDS